MRTLTLAGGMAALVVGGGGALQAQPTRTLRGTVRDGAGLPLEGVQVRVSGTALRAESGEDGRFVVNRVPLDVAGVVVRRIGYRADSLAVPTGTGDPTLSVVLERISVVLPSMIVNARRVYTGPLAGFYRRRESRQGRFFTADDIEKLSPSRISDVLRVVPGLRITARNNLQNTVRLRGSRCVPSYWLDGAPLSSVMEYDIDNLNPGSVAGLEIYSGPAGVPAEFSRERFGSSSCGTVVMWTKRGEHRPRAAKKVDGSAATHIAGLVEAARVFTDRDVDTPAAMDTALIVRPLYPDALYMSGLRGRVLAEYVVNAEGEVQIETFNVVTATNRAFIGPVREALREQRYTPAQRRGVAVSQVVQQPFEFAPDTLRTSRR